MPLRAVGVPRRHNVDKFPFATDGNATDVGNLTVARDRMTQDNLAMFPDIPQEANMRLVI